MIKFYYHPTPNPAKVALFLEESELPYEIVPVDTAKGEQHDPKYLALNPNGRTPTIDDDGVIVFDSNAILLYLAEKTGKFLPTNTPKNKGELYSWLMFVASGIGPYSGQAVHFKHAEKNSPYATKRYDYEAERHWGVIDKRLADHKYMLGDTYTIVDMALWGWARAMPFVLGKDKAAPLTNISRWFAEINARPAAKRAEELKTKHKFKMEQDAETQRIMFRHRDA